MARAGSSKVKVLDWSDVVAEALEKGLDPYRLADQVFRGVVAEEKKNGS